MSVPRHEDLDGAAPRAGGLARWLPASVHGWAMLGAGLPVALLGCEWGLMSSSVASMPKFPMLYLMLGSGFGSMAWPAGCPPGR